MAVKAVLIKTVQVTWDSNLATRNHRGLVNQDRNLKGQTWVTNPDKVNLARVKVKVLNLDKVSKVEGVNKDLNQEEMTLAVQVQTRTGIRIFPELKISILTWIAI